MPRGRKKTTIPVETPVSTEDTAAFTDAVSVARSGDAPPAGAATALAHQDIAVFKNSTATDAPLPESPIDTAPSASSENESAPEPRTERGRFRSWVTDTARGYTRLTDEDEQRIVLQFTEKPSADVLTAVKGAGFQFLADYAGLNHVWVRRNDFETRLQVEAIEKLIGSLPQRDSVPR